MNILGIDPGLRTTGWSILNRDSTLLSFGKVDTSSKDLLENRLVYIFQSIKEVIEIHLPKHMAIENTYTNANSATSLELAHARAASIIATRSMGLEVYYYQAKTIKKSVTGSGNADKESVKKLLMMRIQGVTDVKSKDSIDAIAVAFCHLLHLGL